MRHKRLKLGTVLLLGLGLTGVQAQETISVTGGNTSDSGGSVSWTVGQIVYQTHSGTNVLVSEGVQQYVESETVLGLEQSIEQPELVSVFPNPVAEYFTIKLNDFKASTYTFQLFDIKGKLIQSKNLVANETVVQVRDLVPAYYLLKITNRENEEQIIKIIKN